MSFAKVVAAALTSTALVVSIPAWAEGPSQNKPDLAAPVAGDNLHSGGAMALPHPAPQHPSSTAFAAGSVKSAVQAAPTGANDLK
jgi:hypothetical protein